jgi:hypothetical protein
MASTKCYPLRTVDRCKPENDAVKPVRGKRANCAEQAKNENSEKDSLICLPALESDIVLGI